MKTTYLFLIVFLATTLFSCQDFNEVGTTPDDTTEDVVLKSSEIAVNDVQMESVIEEVSHEAEMFAEAEKSLRRLAKFRGHKDVMKNRKGKNYEEGYAPVISVDTSETGYPVTITIDYGELSILKNGRTLSGVVSIEISAEKGTDGATRTITYTNCTVDSVGIDGTSVHTFNGDNEASKVVSTTSDITFTLADGTTVDRTGTHTRTWIAGIDTPQEREDDILEVTGSTTLSASTGEVWTKSIVETLLRLGSCRHYVQGIVQITYNDVVTSEINFGDGTCDNEATLTVDGETIVIEFGEGKPEAKTEGYKARKGGNGGNGGNGRNN